MNGIGIVRGRGSVKPAPQTRGIVRTRPITGAVNIGLTGDAGRQAETIYEAVRLINAGHSVSEIAGVLHLHEDFLDDLTARFWGD
jgi:hypothetical protein